MLAVVIVSWNVRDLLRQCLGSLLEDLTRGGIGARVMVVDSASQDGSPEMVSREFPRVELITCPDNIGYVRGNNLALGRLEIGDWRYVWLLNPDTEVRRGATSKLVTFMQQHPRCGLCGPQL